MIKQVYYFNIFWQC